MHLTSYKQMLYYFLYINICYLILKSKNKYLHKLKLVPFITSASINFMDVYMLAILFTFFRKLIFSWIEFCFSVFLGTQYRQFEIIYPPEHVGSRIM